MDLWSEICICMFFVTATLYLMLLIWKRLLGSLNGIGTWAPACVTPSLPHCDWRPNQKWQPVPADKVGSQCSGSGPGRFRHNNLSTTKGKTKGFQLSLSTRSICCAFWVRRPSPDMIQFVLGKGTCGMQLRTSCCAVCASPTLTKLRKPGLLGSIPWSSLLTSYCSCQHQQTSSGVSQLVHPQHHSAQTSLGASPSSPVAAGKDKSVDWQSLTRYSNVTKKTQAQVNGPWQSWNAASAAAQDLSYDFYMFV